MRCETRRPLIAVAGCAQFSLQVEPFDHFAFRLSARPSTLRNKERELLPAVSYITRVWSTKFYVSFQNTNNFLGKLP